MHSRLEKVNGTRAFLSLLAAVTILMYLVAGLGSVVLRMNTQIGLVQLVGPIYSFGDLTDQISSAQKDHRVKALLLYVNSPGGAAYACMEIRRYLENFTKPSLAVMDEIAASGAYYIATAADKIVAHANTITGSLGVISIWQDYSGWMKKEGIKFWVWKTGSAKDLYEPWRAPTAEENETIQRTLNQTYEILIHDIARGRPNMTVEMVRQVANGSVYSGLDALKLGLIDEIGDRSDAVDELASKAKLRGYIVRDMSKGDGLVFLGLLWNFFISPVTIAVAIIVAILLWARPRKDAVEDKRYSLRKGI